MTRRSLYTVVAMLFCVLAFAASAHTEAGWTVWHYSVSLTFAAESGLWIPVRTFTTREACEKMAEHLDAIFGGVVETSRSFRYQTYIWCLPYTIGPRGPKGN